MVHLTRRRFVAGAGAGVAAATLSLSGYATAYESGSALTLANYAPRLRNWPEDLELTIAVIADIHACYPWMPEERVGEIVDLANAQKPDLTVLLGDYVCTHRFVSGYVPPSAWAEHWPGSRRRSASMQFWAITTGCRRPFQPSRRITLAVSAGRWRKREFRCSKINRCVCP